VDAAYGEKNFASEAEQRVAFLFERYQAISNLLPTTTTRKKPRKNALNSSYMNTVK